MTVPKSKIATTSEEAGIINVLMLAFSSDPMARWVNPDPSQYLNHFSSFARAFGGGAFSNESAYYIDGYCGAALWLPPGSSPDEEVMINLMEVSASNSIKADIYGVFEEMSNYHPSEPHWYLPLIGVDPSQQNKGYGSALMKHALTMCDRDNQPAYLESSNPRNISLYERHGFEVIGKIQVGSSPIMYPMFRKPRKVQLMP